MSFTYDPVPPTHGTRAGASGSEDIATGFRPAAALRRFFDPPPKRELPDFTLQLATLLMAGTNPPDALETLRPDTISRELRDAVQAIEIATKRGLPLHKAMRRHPRIFDRVYTEIVAAGEAAGTLDTMLDPLAAELIAAQELRRKITSAMIQPMFTVGAALIGGWYMIQTVVPTFASVYEREGVALPAITRVMIQAAEIGSMVGDAGLVAVGAVLLMLPKVLAMPQVRAACDRLVIRLPVIGPLAVLGSVANFMRFYALLISSRMEETAAIELAAHTATNSVVAARLASVVQDVAAGTKKVSGALQKTGMVPATTIQILRTGEVSGQDAQMAAFAAQRLHAKVESQIDQAQKTLVAFVGFLVIAMVGAMMVGLYGPMQGLYEVLLK